MPNANSHVRKRIISQAVILAVLNRRNESHEFMAQIGSKNLQLDKQGLSKVAEFIGNTLAQAAKENAV